MLLVGGGPAALHSFASELGKPTKWRFFLSEERFNIW
jgi:hypothetical protein